MLIIQQRKDVHQKTQENLPILKLVKVKVHQSGSVKITHTIMVFAGGVVDSWEGLKLSIWSHQDCVRIANLSRIGLLNNWKMKMMKNGEMTNFEVSVRTIQAKNLSEGIQGMRGEDCKMTFKYNKKTFPYSGTEISAEKRFIKIDKMLRDYGITKSQWTKDWDSDRIELKFIIEQEGGSAIGIKLVAPLFIAGHRVWNEKLGKSEIKKGKNWAQSLALFEHYLKTKLESIAFGLRDVREEFLADVLVRDSEGRERTIAEVIQPALESAGVQFPQLTAPREEQ